MKDPMETMSSSAEPVDLGVPVVDLSGLTGEACLAAKEKALREHPDAVVLKLMRPEWVLVMSAEEYERRRRAADALAIHEAVKVGVAAGIAAAEDPDQPVSKTYAEWLRGVAPR